MSETTQFSIESEVMEYKYETIILKNQWWQTLGTYAISEPSKYVTYWKNLPLLLWLSKIKGFLAEIGRLESHYTSLGTEHLLLSLGMLIGDSCAEICTCM